MPGVALMGCSALAFSAMAVVIKILKRDLSAQEIVFFRGLLCSLLTVAAMRLGARARLRIPTPPPPREPRSGRAWGLLVLRGVLGATGLFLYTLALGWIPLPDAMALQYTHPFFAGLIAMLALGERMPRRSGWAIAISAAGALVILNPTGTGDWVGNLIGLGSGIASALAYTCVRALSQTESPLTIMLSFHLVACLCAGVIMLASGSTWPSGESWLWLGALALTAQTGQWFLTLGLQKEKTGVATTISYSAIVFGACWEALFFDSTIRPGVLLGTGLMVAGLTWISQLSRAERRAQTAT